MIQVRKSEERGHARHGWLDSYHTFSFADYYDPHHMGFSVLRVINDDTVDPGQGFATHGHRDMEIISYVLEGALEHKDSMGNGSVINAGEIQVLSAGSGITHSEFNHSRVQPVHFLQIWIVPDELELAPNYQQFAIGATEKRAKWRLLASPSGGATVAKIHQDVELYASVLHAGEQLDYHLTPHRRVWLQVAKGNATLNGLALAEGDGVGIEEEKKITLGTQNHAECLLFDLP